MAKLLVQAIVIVMAAGGTARAGLDCDDNTAMRAVEAFAKNRANELKTGDYDFLCVQLGAQHLVKRIEKACAVILDRDTDTDDCVVAAAAAGLGKIGRHDIYARIAAMAAADDPLEAGGGVGYLVPELLERIDDSRGAAVIASLWRATLPRAETREKRHRNMGGWSLWRQRAAAALGQLGSPADADFLDDQATATKDKFVAQACRDGAAAIRARTAKHE